MGSFQNFRSATIEVIGFVVPGLAPARVGQVMKCRCRRVILLAACSLLHRQRTPKGTLAVGVSPEGGIDGAELAKCSALLPGVEHPTVPRRCRGFARPKDALPCISPDASGSRCPNEAREYQRGSSVVPPSPAPRSFTRRDHRREESGKNRSPYILGHHERRIVRSSIRPSRRDNSDAIASSDRSLTPPMKGNVH